MLVDIAMQSYIHPRPGALTIDHGLAVANVALVHDAHAVFPTKSPTRSYLMRRLLTARTCLMRTPCGPAGFFISL